MKNILGTCLYVCASFLSFGQDMQKNDNEKRLRTILFICEHGAGRSPIAAAYFNKLAQEQGLNYRAVFKGTNPDSSLGAAVKDGLVNDGFNLNGWKPAPVTKQDLENAFRVITLDCPLREKGKPITEWTGIPSMSNYIIARDTIVKKVQALIVELSRKSKGRN